MVQKIILIFKCLNCNGELRVSVDEFVNRDLSLNKPCSKCRKRMGYLFLRRAFEKND
jgi:hypothetical protein